MSKIGLKEVAFFGYAVTDFAKARQFYGEILGLTEIFAEDHNGELGWVEYDIAGQTLALAKASPQWQPSSHGGGVSLELEDLDRAVEYLRNAGVTVAMEILDCPVCRLALVADPDGNTIALHQRKANHPDCTGH